jgi:hypothetical protein
MQGYMKDQQRSKYKSHNLLYHIPLYSKLIWFLLSSECKIALQLVNTVLYPYTQCCNVTVDMWEEISDVAHLSQWPGIYVEDVRN